MSSLINLFCLLATFNKKRSPFRYMRRLPVAVILLMKVFIIIKTINNSWRVMSRKNIEKLNCNVELNLLFMTNKYCHKDIRRFSSSHWFIMIIENAHFKALSCRISRLSYTIHICNFAINNSNLSILQNVPTSSDGILNHFFLLHILTYWY